MHFSSAISKTNGNATVDSHIHVRSINSTISNEWVDYNVVENSTSKAEKSLVHMQMWNNRIRLSFPGKVGADMIIGGILRLDLTSHKRGFLL